MSSTHHLVLASLLVLARRDEHATVLRLAQATGLDRAAVEAALIELDRAGYVDAERVRLSMGGLAAAMLLGPAKSARRPRRAPLAA